MPKRIDPAIRQRGLRMLEEHRHDYASDTPLVEAIANKPGTGRETVRRWLVQADVDAGSRPGTSSDEQAEIKRLKAENRRVPRGQRDPQGGNGFLRWGTRPRNR